MGHFFMKHGIVTEFGIHVHAVAETWDLTGLVKV